MKTEFTFLKSNDYDVWDNFVLSCEESTVFHYSHLLIPLAEALHCRFRIAIKKDAENNIIAGFPFLEKKKFGLLRIIYFPPMLPFYGIIHLEKQTKHLNKRTRHSHKIYNEFIDFIEKKYNYIRITFPVSNKDIRPFLWKGFTCVIHYTYYSDISSLTECFNNFDPDIRRRIKKAEKTDYQLDTNVDKEQISDVFELQEKSFKRQGITFKLSKNQFIDYITYLNSKSLVKIYTIKLKNIPVSSILILYFRDTAYYWITGIDNNYLSEGYNQLNFWLMLQDLHSDGIRKFDFVGASTPTIAEYKGTYNFDLQPYYMVERAFNRTTSLLFKLKEIMS